MADILVADGIRQVAYQDGEKGKPVYALEGSSTCLFLVSRFADLIAETPAQSPSLVAQSSGKPLVSSYTGRPY